MLLWRSSVCPEMRTTWFAWHPVWVHDRGLVWLETVRREWTDAGTDVACWEYWPMCEREING